MSVLEPGSQEFTPRVSFASLGRLDSLLCPGCRGTSRRVRDWQCASYPTVNRAGSTPQPFFSFSLPGIESSVLCMLSYNPSLSCLLGLVSTFYFVVQSTVLLSGSVWPRTHTIVQQRFELATAFQVARIIGLYHQAWLSRKLFGPECQIC